MSGVSPTGGDSFAVRYGWSQPFDRTHFPEQEEIHTLITDGNIDRVREIIERNRAVVCSSNKRGISPLHTAVRVSNIKIVELLLANGADVNAKDKNGQTPLHLVEDEVIASLLLKEGALVDGRDNSSRTALHEKKNLRVAKLLVAYNADVNAKDDTDITPLHTAVNANNVDLARLLLTHGADVDAKDDDRVTPLHTAANANNVDLARLLLTHGADVNAVGEDDQTALHFAEDVEMVRLLLEKGASVDLRDRFGRTALYEKKELQAVRLLIAYGADVNMRDYTGMTPLHLACSKEIAEYLIENGADVNARNENGCTPLRIASSYSLIRVLVEHGADVNSKDILGQSCLHEAASAQIVQFLIGQGALIDEKTNSGYTPLFNFVKLLDSDETNYSLEIMNILISKGANLDVEDNEGISLLEAAMGRLDVFKMLISKGAKIKREIFFKVMSEGRFTSLRSFVIRIKLQSLAREFKNASPYEQYLALASFFDCLNISQLEPCFSGQRILELYLHVRRKLSLRIINTDQEYFKRGLFSAPSLPALPADLRLEQFLPMFSETVNTISEEDWKKEYRLVKGSEFSLHCGIKKWLTHTLLGDNEDPNGSYRGGLLWHMMAGATYPDEVLPFFLIPVERKSCFPQMEKELFYILSSLSSDDFLAKKHAFMLLAVAVSGHCWSNIKRAMGELYGQQVEKLCGSSAVIEKERIDYRLLEDFRTVRKKILEDALKKNRGLDPSRVEKIMDRLGLTANTGEAVKAIFEDSITNAVLQEYTLPLLLEVIWEFYKIEPQKIIDFLQSYAPEKILKIQDERQRSKALGNYLSQFIDSGRGGLLLSGGIRVLELLQAFNTR